MQQRLKRRMWVYFVLAGIFMFVYLQNSCKEIGVIYEFALMLTGACLAFAVSTLLTINRNEKV